MMFSKLLSTNPKATKILLGVAVAFIVGGLIFGIIRYFSPKATCTRQIERLLKNASADAVKDKNYMETLREREIETCLRYKESSIKR